MNKFKVGDKIKRGVMPEYDPIWTIIGTYNYMIWCYWNGQYQTFRMNDEYITKV